MSISLNNTTDSCGFNLTDGGSGDSIATDFSALNSFYEQYTFVHGYLAACVCVFGLFGNMVVIMVLTHKKMPATPVNFLLTMVAISNLLLVAIYLPMAIYFYIVENDRKKEPLYSYEKSSAVYLKISLSLTLICHTTAVWHTIAVASFRWLTLGLANGKQYSTLFNAKLCSVVLVGSNIVLSIPNWISQIVVSESYCYTTPPATIIVFWTVGNKKGTEYNYWLFATYGRIVPSVLLTALTILLVRIMIQAEFKRQQLLERGRNEESKRHQEHNRTTGMLLAVVIIFLIVEVPQGGFIICMSYIPDAKYVYNYVADFLDLVTLVAFSINFILYTIMSRQFRMTLVSIFCAFRAKGKRTGIHRVSTMLTSIKPSSVQKRSNTYSSCSSNCHLKPEDKFCDSICRHTALSPLISEDGTCTTIMSDGGSANGLRV